MEIWCRSSDALFRRSRYVRLWAFADVSLLVRAAMERPLGVGYHRQMRQSLRRLFILVAVTWLVIWGYVGWRGHDMTNEAHRFIDVVPPGARVPKGVLEALDAGQSYILNAAIWGAVVPLLLFLIGWVLKPYIRECCVARH
jgi:hypothetical protein